jgi:site-specific recombinase XerD
LKLSAAVDLFVADRRSQGRINSPNTEAAYRAKLDAHAEDVSERDPSKTGRDDVKRTLRRWEHPNSQRQAHAVLTSFYDWCMEEGIRDTNPARMVRRAKARKVSIYRPTREEVVRLVAAAETQRERWAVHLGVLAGLRREEMRLLRREHFARPGFIHVSSDIAKGNRERWVPVLPELEPIVAEILLLVQPGWFILPGRRNNSRLNTIQRDVDAPISDGGLHKLVKRVGRRAGLAVEIGPHTLRHAFGDHVTRQAGLKVAQELMGHASSATTESAYTGRATLDELAAGVKGFAYGLKQATAERSALQVSHNVDTEHPAEQSQKPSEKGSR